MQLNEQVTDEAEAFEMLRARYEVGVRHAALASAAAVATIGSLVWTSQTRVAVILWILLMAAAIPLPVMMKRGAVSDDRFRSILWKFELAQGALWPAITLVAMPSDPAAQAVLGSIYVALVLGGATRISQFSRTLESFLIPLSVLSMIGFLLHGSDEIRFLGLIVAIVSLLTASTAYEQRSLHDELVESSQLNRALRIELEASEKELTTTNRLLSEAVQRADHRSRTDPLTAVANRFQLDQQLSAKLRMLGEGDLPALTLAYMDLDKFKSVNDTLGHSAGDELLLAVTGRLGGALDDSELLARIGGDEMVVISQSADAQGLGQRLVSTFDHPFSIEGHLLAVSASVGIAVTTQVVSRDELLGRADAAQYEAKRSGGASFLIYDPRHHSRDAATNGKRVSAIDQSAGQ